MTDGRNKSDWRESRDFMGSHPSPQKNPENQEEGEKRVHVPNSSKIPKRVFPFTLERNPEEQ
jgi:hypothetical protein